MHKITKLFLPVSTHSRPKAAEFGLFGSFGVLGVSTHSRPKAAEFKVCHLYETAYCFNTQPPEGG